MKLVLQRIVLLSLISVFATFSIQASSLVSVKEVKDSLKQPLIIPLESTKNTRELGAYTTRDGRKVKTGLLIRSDSLANLTSSDLATLKNLGIKTITDFRSDVERHEAPDRIPEQKPEIAYQVLDVLDPTLNIQTLRRKILSGQISDADLHKVLSREFYITDPKMRRLWGSWLKAFAEPQTVPHLFHCTAGKDRTGFAAVILLLTLGVPKEQVMHDFMVTNQLLAKTIDLGVKRISAMSDVNSELMRGVLGVSQETIDGVFEAIDAHYGSVDNYIASGLGIDAATRTRIQTLLLE